MVGVKHSSRIFSDTMTSERLDKFLNNRDLFDYTPFVKLSQVIDIVQRIHKQGFVHNGLDAKAVVIGDGG